MSDPGKCACNCTKQKADASDVSHFKLQVVNKKRFTLACELGNNVAVVDLLRRSGFVREKYIVLARELIFQLLRHD